MVGMVFKFYRRQKHSDYLSSIDIIAHRVNYYDPQMTTDNDLEMNRFVSESKVDVNWLTRVLSRLKSVKASSLWFSRLRVLRLMSLGQSLNIIKISGLVHCENWYKQKTTNPKSMIRASAGFFWSILMLNKLNPCGRAISFKCVSRVDRGLRDDGTRLLS